ncbi:CD79B protein, partial [Nothoprocta ornata]|nr:CD79B protein [Nothoprocta ornata]
CSWVHQYPRFVAAKRNTPVHFICYCSEPQHMQWYKVQDNERLYRLEGNTSHYSVEWKDRFINFTIFKIAYKDNGLYVCDRKNLTEAKQVHACGTELRVMSHSNIQQVQNRNTLKDAIIIIQTILLVVFISVPLLFFLDKVSDSKESPEEDHTYEGLEVEQMATYEDITPFRDVKAKWTFGEHPGEE